MTFVHDLHPYQVADNHLMVARGRALAAYDTGTGKTVLAIAAIEELMDRGKIREPGLVIALSSLKYQWQSQIHHFSGGTSRALVIDGTPAQRRAQYDEAMAWRETGVDYIIMNYDQISLDWEHVRKLPRGFIVADEATALKAFRSQRSRKVKELAKKVPVRYALTATPIENGKPEELFSIMQFVDPDVLGAWPSFDARYIVRNFFGGVDHYVNLDHLNQRLKGVLVRKAQTDPDVAPYMPDTIHRDPVTVRLDPGARKLYQVIQKELLADLDALQEEIGHGGFNLSYHYGDDDAEAPTVISLKGQIMSKLTALRMLCDHPDLLRISADKARDAGSKSGSQYALSLMDRGLVPDNLKTPKLDAVVQYVKDHLEVEGHKIVLFSVFVPTLDLLAERLKEFNPVTYSGQMNAKTKEANKVRFQTDPDVRILISSDAGGYGVDLPQANLLVNYDLPWSQGAAMQRNGRIQRASSKWPTVTIQDFLIQGSVEVRQHEVLQGKGSVASAILDGVGLDKDGGLTLSIASLRQFLSTTGI